jgi:hypothetical protein
MEQEMSVLEKLQIAHEMVAEALAQAPQLYESRLDQALLVLALAMKQARRSKQLRPPPPQSRFNDQDVPF